MSVRTVIMIVLAVLIILVVTLTLTSDLSDFLERLNTPG